MMLRVMGGLVLAAGAIQLRYRSAAVKREEKRRR
jgi:hypothetical protein